MHASLIFRKQISNASQTAREDSARRRKGAGLGEGAIRAGKEADMEKVLVAVAAGAVGVGAILAGVAARRRNYVTSTA